MTLRSFHAQRRHRRATARPIHRKLVLERFERRDLLTTVELLPLADNTLYEDLAGTISNGSGDHFFAGRVGGTGGGDIQRGLIRFDLSTIPANAIINSVTLDLNMSRTRAGDESVSLHVVLADWGEAGSHAPGEEGDGGTAQANDATWIHTFSPTTTWVSAGGDFNVTASDSTQVGGNGRYQWSSTQMATDVTNWISQPITNFGWLLMGNESATRTSKRFDSRENTNTANRPKLIVDFDVPDTTPPTPIITGPASPTNNDPFDVNIAFGEAVTGFATGDISVGNGTVTQLVDNGSGSFTATIDATSDGNVTVDISAGVANDLAGNANLAAMQYSTTVDTISPAPSINGPASPSNTDPFNVTIAFGEAVTGFVSSDIAVGNGAVTNLVDNGGGNFTATIDASGDGNVTVDISAGVAADGAGNGNIAAAQFIVSVDTTSPIPTISGPSSPTNTDPFNVTIDFGETVTGFVSGDIAVGNGAVTNLVDNGGGSFTATIDASADGNVTIDIGAGVATDGAGNGSAAATQFAIDVDTAPPTPTITGPSSPTNADPFNVTIDFGESVSGFVTGDITIGGGTVTDLIDNGGGNFTATINASADGNVTVDIAAGVANDSASNGNVAASQFSALVDTAGPTPTITGPASPTNIDPFSVTIDFGEAVTGFVSGGITVGGGTVTNLVDNGGGNYTATINSAANGLVTVDLSANVASDLAGNASLAATQFAVTVDTVGRTPTITGPASPTNVDPFNVTIAFGETVTGFVAGDITVAGGSVTNMVDDGGGNFTATIEATTDGNVTVDIPPGVATDGAGNTNNAAAQFSIAVDTTAPTPTISGPASPATTATFDVAIAFGEPVTGFVAGDITVAGGSVTNLIDQGGGNYAATIEPPANGILTIDIASGVATDAASNPNIAATQFSIVVAARFDFGDAPTAAQSGFAKDYPVTLAQDGARHLVGSLILGSLVDSEEDGLPTADADGDGEDDDGVIFVSSLVASQTSTTSTLQVIASSAGLLDGWIDFNQDGDWDDVGEQILMGENVMENENVLPFTIPPNATVGTTGARFRLSSEGGLAPTGAADDGEVEDYRVQILDGGAVGAVLDVTGTGSPNPLQDGILIVRFMLGQPDANLEDPALIPNDASRMTGAAIRAHLVAAGDVLDANGDGTINPFQDGILIVRFLMGQPDANLEDPTLIPAGSTRTTGAEIRAYLESLMPPQTGGSIVPQASAGGEGEQVILADVNGDRSVTVRDVFDVLNEVDQGRADDQIWSRLDANLDDKVSIADALFVINRLADNEVVAHVGAEDSMDAVDRLFSDEAFGRELF